MKKYYLLATALAALVSCSENEFIGDNNLGEANGQAPISFDLNTPAVTRAADRTGADAAGDLNNQFIIWGEKNEAGTGAEATATNLVFKNYIVKYASGTNFSTTSNTKGWEYVGFKFDDATVSPSTENYSTNITPNTKGESASAVEQTIKYWDFGATSYTFTAISALPGDIKNGNVTIKKNTTGASSSDFNKGYEIEVKTGAALDNIFVADRNVINQGTGTDRTAMNAYGGNATMKFRNFMSKIRFGIYETIPGYKVKITNVHYNNADHTTSFGVDGKFLAVGNGTDTHTKFTVTYENPSNKAIVDVQSGAVTTGYFETAPIAEVTGENPKPGIIVPILSADNIGTTPTTATFDKTEKVTSPASEKAGVYTTILPFTTNDTNIKLQIDYKLISEDTNEEISITGKTAEVPKEYCRWKSNYAYSYLFKITDSDLYPITFDAVEVVDENGLAEYITTVTQPSITTYANKSNVTVDNEYLTGSNIYVAVMEGVPSTNKTLTVGTNAKLYKATAEDGFVEGITENTVANALKNGTKDDSSSPTTWTLTDAGSKTMVVSSASGLTAFTTIPAADSPTGAILTINGAYFTPTAPTFTAVTGLTAGSSAVTGYYTRSGDAEPYVYTKITAADAKAVNGTTYYEKTATTAGYYVFEYKDGSDNLHYKVIKVVDKY